MVSRICKIVRLDECVNNAMTWRLKLTRNMAEAYFLTGFSGAHWPFNSFRSTDGRYCGLCGPQWRCSAPCQPKRSYHAEYSGFHSPRASEGVSKAAIVGWIVVSASGVGAKRPLPTSYKKSGGPLDQPIGCHCADRVGDGHVEPIDCSLDQGRL